MKSYNLIIGILLYLCLGGFVVLTVYFMTTPGTQLLASVTAGVCCGFLPALIKNL